ncbi:MAG TPA: magnesium transporter [Acidimicrobiia bacterium]|nr:magnesium transporter [Acidimicrobiia bacterium]
MKLRLRSPRQLARLLLAQARRQPEAVEEYLDAHGEEWEALAALAPGAAAAILGELDEDALSELISDLEAPEAAEVLAELHAEVAADLLEDLPQAEAAALLEEMTPEDAADVLSEVEQEAAESLIDLLTAEAASEVRKLLTYPPDSAGGLMTTDVARLPIGMNAGEAIERIRQLREELDDLSYVYVTDDDGTLAGVVSFRDLVFNRPGSGLSEVMVSDPIVVGAEADRAEVNEIISQYHILAVPVVDGQGKLLGVVTTDAVIESVQEEASEDFAAAMGAGVTENVRSPVWSSVRARLPWIAFDVLISSSVVWAVSQFNEVLDSFVVLAALMPLVARVGGDAGAQSLAVVIRSLAADEIPQSGNARVVGREATIGAINGVAIAILSGILGFAMQEIRQGPSPVRIGVAMAIAALANLVVAGIAGSGIPLLLRRAGFDPALGSNLFLTTVTDLLGFAGFLAVATLLLH